MDTETVPLDTLVPDPANVRTHDDRNLEAIRGSLARFGQQKPIVVDHAGVIRAGNGTYHAAKALGWKTISIVRTDLENLEATAFAIADNRTSDLSEFDLAALGPLLDELKIEDELEGVGFDDSEVDEILAELKRDLNLDGSFDDPGPKEPPEEPVTRTGDLWVLGDHRLLCGDSTSADDVSRVLVGEQAALFSTDPPYCVNYTGNDRPIHDGKPSGKDWSHLYREVDITDLGEFLDAVFAACLPNVADAAGIYVWHAHVQQPTIAAAFERHGLLLHQVLVWVKPCATFGHCYYRWKHEPCAFGWKRGNKPTHGLGQLETVWEADWDGKARFTGDQPRSHRTAESKRATGRRVEVEERRARGDVGPRNRVPSRNREHNLRAYGGLRRRSSARRAGPSATLSTAARCQRGSWLPEANEKANSGGESESAFPGSGSRVLRSLFRTTRYRVGLELGPILAPGRVVPRIRVLYG